MKRTYGAVVVFVSSRHWTWHSRKYHRPNKNSVKRNISRDRRVDSRGKSWIIVDNQKLMPTYDQHNEIDQYWYHNISLCWCLHSGFFPFSLKKMIT